MPAVPLFWLFALLLVAATVTALVWPLLRGRTARGTDSDEATTDLYRDQKRQLDDELAAGAITRVERDSQLEELAARLGAELNASAAPSQAPAAPKTSYVAALVLAAAIPVSAMALYVAFGSPDALRIAAKPNERERMPHEQIVAMVESLAARMKQHPDDPTGWKLLARAYSAMGRYAEAVAAFTEAGRRSPQEDPSLLADWADALAMQNQSLQGEPLRLVERALALDPNHQKSLSLAASAAFDRKDYDTAIAQWRKLQAQFPAGSEGANDVAAVIAEAEAAKRGTPATGMSTANAAAPAPAAAVATISGRVSLDPKLRDRVAANDTLFIFARAANGPRMPLAIVRTTAGDLPREFRLDDSMAMTPAARLSNAGDVIVEARISKSGNATPSPGDLQGTGQPVKPGANGVLIVINDVVR
jgi:cytochrome c-type biogenesis protein CcmH